MRQVLARGTAGLVLGLVLVPALAPVPAQARPPSDLGITVPGPADLGSGTPGQTISGNLGTVTVTDSAGLIRSIEVTVSVKAAFTVTQAGQSWSLPNGRVSYWSGPLSSTSLGVCGISQPTSAFAVGLGGAQKVVSCLTLLSIAPSFSWNPRLVIDTPSTIPSGTFTGTITHSVA